MIVGVALLLLMASVSRTVAQVPIAQNVCRTIAPADSNECVCGRALTCEGSSVSHMVFNEDQPEQFASGRIPSTIGLLTNLRVFKIVGKIGGGASDGARRFAIDGIIRLFSRQ